MLTIALPRPAQADVAVLIIDGRGFGHGVGMAQDGAYWMGRAGATTEEILGQFYPGTRPGQGSGHVRVPVLDAGPPPASAVLVFPTGGLVRDAPPHELARAVDMRVAPGGRVTIRFDGIRYAVFAGHSSVQQSSAPSRPAITPARTAQAEPLPTSSTTTSSSTTTTVPPVATTAPTSTTTTAPSTTTTSTPTGDKASPSGPSSPHPLWAIPDRGGTIGVPARDGRHYRGAIEATGHSGNLRLVNEVDLEIYLKGMGEVRDPTWPPAAMRAQAVAARTYALRAMAVGDEICDTQRCQVYLGATAEYPAMNRAVDDTRGQVLTFRRQLASAVYSANGGGHSASREEGFGETGGDYPYLRPSPYPTQDPSPWTVEVSLSDVAARLAYPGTLHAIAVDSAGPSGRAQTLTFDGTAGRQQRSGLEVAHALRLRSTLFSVRVGSASIAPTSPEGDSIIQAPPELVGTTPQTAATGGRVDRLPVSFDASAPGLDGSRRSISGIAVWAAVMLALVAAAAVALATGRAGASAGGGLRSGRSGR